MKLRNAVFKPNIVDYVRVRLPSTPLKNALFTGILGIRNIKVLNKVLKNKIWRKSVKKDNGGKMANLWRFYRLFLCQNIIKGRNNP